MFPIDAFRNTLAKVVGIFESLEIRFHLTGGITTVAYGEPRMTQDIDLVIDNAVARARVDDLVNTLLHTDFMFDETSLRAAIDDRQMFQLLDRVEILKLDIYPREMIPGELQRSVITELFEGMYLPIASRADAAASKLVWISKGSHKSRRDLRQIVRSATERERQLIAQLAEQLALHPLLHQVLAEPDEFIG